MIAARALPLQLRSPGRRATELILRNWAAQSFGMVVLSSVTASVIGRAAFGNAPFLTLPPFTVHHPVGYLLFAALGLGAGAVGVLFTRLLYLVEDAWDAAWRWPEWLRPAVGGLLLGGLLLVLPQMYGVGYPVLGRGVQVGYAVGFLIILMFGKMLATSLTIGIAGSGGVFAPSLFIGAMFGAAGGQALHAVLPGATGPLGAHGLIGMGTVFAGAARAPITAVIIMFELTGDYSIMLALMAAIVLATGVGNLLTRDTIYTLKLRRRGMDLESRPVVVALTTLRVRDAAQPVGRVLAGATALTDAASALEDETLGQLPVVDGDGRYVGVLSARAAADLLADGAHDGATVQSAAEPVTALRADLSLEDALDQLDTTDIAALPVLDPTEDGVAGWLSSQGVLAAIRMRAPAESR